MCSPGDWAQIQIIVPQQQVSSKLKFVTNKVIQQYCPWMNIQLKQDNMWFYLPQAGIFVGQGQGTLGGQLGTSNATAAQE